MTGTVRRLASVATAILFASSTLWAQEQVLSNPGFEELTDAGVPAGWQVDEGLQVLTGEDALAGERAVRVRYQGGLRQDVPTRPGEMYVLRGYTRRPPGEAPLSGRVLIRWLDDDGRKVRGNTDYRHPAGKRWEQFTHLIAIPDGCTHIHLVVDGPYETTDRFDFDELSMLRTDRLAALSPTAIEACGQPLRAVQIADCHSFALLRLPWSMDDPCDGKVDTFATMSPYVERPNPHTEVDFDFTFHRPERVSLCLIHTIASPIQRATLFAERDGRWEQVAEIENDARTLLAAEFAPVTTRRMRLRIHKRPEDETITVNEVQFFERGGAVPPTGAALRLAAAPAPEDFAEALRHASGSEGPGAVALAGDPGEPIPLGAGATLEILGEAYDAQSGIAGVTAELVFDGAEPDRAVEVAVMSPNIRDRSINAIHLGDRNLTGRYAVGSSAPPNIDLRALFRGVVPLQPDGARSVARLSVDIPDMLARPGERVWLRVTPLADETLLCAESSISLQEIAPEEALGEYLPDLERILRRAYAACTEAHVYDGALGRREEMALVRLLREVLALDPGNFAARKIQHRVMRTRERVDLERPGPADAPDWAVWQRELMRGFTEIVHWWIDERQLPNGELGGVWADDTELSCEWAFLPLVTGDPKVRDSLELIAEGVWGIVGDGGYSPRTMDAEHAAEYVTLTQPQMMLLDYGNPLYVERCMQMIKHMEWWTLINDQGHRHFRSYMFNATSIDDSEGRDFDNEHNAYAAKPGLYAAWYSANEQPRRWLTEWAEGWLAAAMSTQKGKPVGAIPPDVQAKTGEIAPYTDRWNQSAYMSGGGTHVRDLLFAAWDWTGDERFLAPFRYPQGLRAPEMTWRVVSGDTARDDAVISGADTAIEQNEALNGSDEENSWSATSMYSELQYYWAWRATERSGAGMRYLVEGLKEQCRNIERMRWLITEAEPYTDRAYIPGDRLLPFMALGGNGGEVRASYPDFAVSWEGIGERVAPLVVERSGERLRVLAYSFADEPIEAVMRTWSVRPGRWKITVGLDRDGDGTMDGQAQEREMELFRYAPVALTLAPRATTVIDAELLQPGEDVRARPDLALCARDIRRDGDGLLVTVHNIGAADVAAGVAIAALDGERREVARATLPAVPAPMDCIPGSAEVRLPAPAAFARIDPDDALDEITEVNNLATAP